MKIRVFLGATVLIFAVSWTCLVFVASLGETSPYARELPLIIRLAESLGLERPAQLILCVLDFGMWIVMAVAGRQHGSGNTEIILTTLFSSAVWGYIIARTVAFLKSKRIRHHSGVEPPVAD